MKAEAGDISSRCLATSASTAAATFAIAVAVAESPAPPQELEIEVSGHHDQSEDVAREGQRRHQKNDDPIQRREMKQRRHVPDHLKGIHHAPFCRAIRAMTAAAMRGRAATIRERRNASTSSG